MEKVTNSAPLDQILNRRRKAVLIMILMYGITTIDAIILILELYKGSLKISLMVPMIFAPLFIGLLFQAAIKRLDREIKDRTH